MGETSAEGDDHDDDHGRAHVEWQNKMKIDHRESYMTQGKLCIRWLRDSRLWRDRRIGLGRRLVGERLQTRVDRHSRDKEGDRAVEVVPRDCRRETVGVTSCLRMF